MQLFGAIKLDKSFRMSYSPVRNSQKHSETFNPQLFDVFQWDYLVGFVKGELTKENLGENLSFLKTSLFRV